MASWAGLGQWKLPSIPDLQLSVWRSDYARLMMVESTHSPNIFSWDQLPPLCNNTLLAMPTHILPTERNWVIHIQPHQSKDMLSGCCLSCQCNAMSYHTSMEGKTHLLFSAQKAQTNKVVKLSLLCIRQFTLLKQTFMSEKKRQTEKMLPENHKKRDCKQTSVRQAKKTKGSDIFRPLSTGFPTMQQYLVHLQLLIVST